VGGSLFILSQTFQSWDEVEQHFIETLPKLEVPVSGLKKQDYLHNVIFGMPPYLAALVSTHADQYSAGES